MASSSQLEQRVASLEAEVARLKRKLDKLDRTIPWWEQIAATFENDPIYEIAMQLGREYRQSLRPKTTPRRKQQMPYLVDFLCVRGRSCVTTVTRAPRATSASAIASLSPRLPPVTTTRSSRGCRITHPARAVPPLPWHNAQNGSLEC
jgi:hypothetical protein